MAGRPALQEVRARPEPDRILRWTAPGGSTFG